MNHIKPHIFENSLERTFMRLMEEQGVKFVDATPPKKKLEKKVKTRRKTIKV